ncbi:CHAT domain-containing protein [Roseofilum casamattae]|uniref:CHAT domain-containing protein n=1 Tax=Roseofilum casamattae BLCC-M143 TaxID=3022442 RepID=A0ABT7BZ09_9CYAN|nr:CHAT domain-containing protein [Roseofilum casamattae]MDJ1183724.1 CHAT domain-containing protein [Roseofilum casamattae BLCC-M143]
MLRLWNWLKRLFNRLFGKSHQPPQPPAPTPAPAPDNARCEAVFMELLEGIYQGQTRGQSKGFLMAKNIKEATLIAWLREFAEQVQQNREQHQELGKRLQKLGNLGWGELSQVAAGLARELVVEEPRAEVIEAEFEGDGLGTEEEVWLERGNTQFMQGDLLGAIASYDKALEIKPDYHEAWYNRGLALGNLGRYEDAIASYDKALEIKPDDHQAWYSRGVTLGNLGRNEDAIASYDKALEIKPDYYEAWINRGIAAGNVSYSAPLQPSALTLQYPQLNQRGFEGKLASYQQGLTFCTQEKQPQGWGRLHRQIGRAYYNRGRKSLYSRDAGRSDFREALHHYGQALQTLTREAYPEDYLELIQDLIRVCNALGNESEAKAWRNEGLDVWSQLLADPHKSSYQKRQLAIKFIRFARMRVDVLLEDNQPLDAFRSAEEQKNLYLTWILDRQQETNLSPTYEQVQQTLLDTTTALIFWHLSDLTLTTFLLLPDESAPIPFTTSPEPLKRWLHHWDKAYEEHRETKASPQSEWRATLRQRLEELRDILHIPTLLSHLQPTENNPVPLTKGDLGGSNLILIPHLDLHRLPLHILFPDNFTITTLPSAQVGIQTRSQDIGKPDNALIVEPPANSLEKLPLAELEAKVISYLCNTSRLIPHNNATQTTLKEQLAQPYHLFHFTGHGSHDFKSPLDSCLLLQNDETLALRELIDRDFPLPNLRLVSLSACETAVTSREAFDDDYVGLVSGFLSRGTTQVLSTLWTVLDSSSGLFMMEFYWQLLQENQSPTRAFYYAQHWLKTLTPAQLVVWYHERGQFFLDKGESIEEEDLQLRVSDPGEQLQRKSRTLQKKIETGNLSPDTPLYAHPYYWAAFTLTHG